MSPTSEPANPQSELINFLWFSFYGSVVAGIGLYVQHKERYEQANLKEVTGTIVGSVQRRDPESNDLEYAPIVEFIDNGKPIRFNRIPDESFKRSEGTAVTIRYDPKDPAGSATLLDPLNGLLIWLPFAIAGIVWIVGLRSLWQLFQLRSTHHQ